MLFTADVITLAEANAILEHQGFREVLRFDEVRQVDKIPILGTGKVDYKVLRERIEAGRRRLQHAEC